MSISGGVEVISGDLRKHPRCPHGPTLLFARQVDGAKRRFFACSACRDRKGCAFFLYEDERGKLNGDVWEAERKKLVGPLDHRRLFLTLNEVQRLPKDRRAYCRDCGSLELEKFWPKHRDKEHKLKVGLSDHQLRHPTELLLPLEDTRKEAQFWFSKSTIGTIAGLIEELGYSNVINVGTPRLQEHFVGEGIGSLLLDIDRRYHSFYGPLQFCWYNMFNHHFFLPEAKDTFEDCLGNKNTVVVIDPPFGGRVEPLAHTIRTMNELHKKLNNTTQDLPVFWVFPYFMEPQIRNSLPNFAMSDFKVDYDNHPLFRDGPKGRKQGSPVRIFTNIPLSKITLPEGEGYKFCEQCEKWVSNENRHCGVCGECTSKDGRTYVHCSECERCVKPTWQHCKSCQRCAQKDHKCGQISFVQECFHCKQPGHKKRDCPQVDHKALTLKRKLGVKTKSKKKKKQKLSST